MWNLVVSDLIDRSAASSITLSASLSSCHCNCRVSDGSMTAFVLMRELWQFLDHGWLVSLIDCLLILAVDCLSVNSLL